MQVKLENAGTMRKAKIMERYGCTMDEARRLKAGETVDLEHLTETMEEAENINDEGNEDHG